MKLRTSFFNVRVLLKNLTRFAPVWVLYTVAEVLGLLSLNLEKAGIVADDLTHIMGPVSIFHGVYALIVAACLFGDLFDSRMCNGLHAMPMRRVGWLLTNLASGLIFALIPAVVGGAVAVAILKEYYWIGLLWQATSLLQFVFFFGVAVFSAMCAGKRLGMIAIYGILNFLSVLIFWVADTVFEPLLPGVMLSDDWFILFCPLVSILEDTYLNFYYDGILGGFFKGFYAENWNYLYICAGIGVLLTVLGWLLYRKRHLETAGDFISFRPMRMFFLLTYTVAAGALLYSFGELFLGTYRDYGFLVVGILIGWFTGWMLLERTVKIFNRKVFIGLVAFAAVFAGSIGLTIMDPMGIAAYVPETEKIENACLYLSTDYYNFLYGSGSEDDRDLSKPEDIAQIQQLHRMMLETPEETDEEYIIVYVRYERKNGTSVLREYKIPPKSKTAAELNDYFSDLSHVFGTDGWERVKESTEVINVYLQGGMHGIDISDPQQKQALFAALEADSAANNLAQHDYFHLNQEYVGSVDIAWETLKTTQRGAITIGRNITIYEDCVNTSAFLETLQEKE